MSVKISKKKLTSTNKADFGDLQNVLQGLSGNEKYVNKFVVLDKHNELIEKVESICKLITNFNKNIIQPNIESNAFYRVYDKKISEYCEDCTILIRDYKTVDLENVFKKYSIVKEHPTIIESLNMLKVLNKYKSYINDSKNLSLRFVYDTPSSTSINIFTFCDLDLKIMLESDLKRDDLDKLKKYIAYFLHLLYKHTKSIYDTILKPDIDTEEIASVFMKVIQNAKTQIPRCDKAFNLIEKSFNKFSGNMDRYYKDMVISKDSTTLINSFLLDITESGDDDSVDLEVVLQIKKIIEHFKKVSSQRKVQNTQLTDLFSKADELINILEQ